MTTLSVTCFIHLPECWKQFNYHKEFNHYGREVSAQELIDSCEKSKKLKGGAKHGNRRQIFECRE